MAIIKIIGKIDKLIEKFASAALVFCVLTMLFMTLMTIVLRWFNVSFQWAEPLIRHLVFLSAFLGGVIATGRGTHISIDIVGKYFENNNMIVARNQLKRVVSLASFCTLVWLIKASIQFVLVELKYGHEVFFKIHSGYLVAIIPFGLGLICFRFGYIFLDSFVRNPPPSVGHELEEI